jgi:putative spermidine/putrescine transport system substrate-binding protein
MKRFASVGLCALLLLLVATGAFAQTTDMKALVAAAQKEGQLTVIALPHSWVNYGEMIATFSAKYGIKVNELNPDGSSAEEMEAIKANKGNMGPQAPDVVDVGLKFGPEGVASGLFAPYKVSTWASIPDSVKDKNGYWYGDYYGAISFEVNTDVIKNVPKTWADLLKPEYKGKFALSGDPRISNQAFLTVMAASIANGGSADNLDPGLQYFAKMNKAGNLIPLIAVTGTLASGETPITIEWDYNALANKDTLAGNPEIQIIVPNDGVVAGVYIQAISAYAPHPNAAKLWMEYIYSDEGQLIWLKGYGHPVRFNDMAKRNVVPAALAAKLPPSSSYANAVFPTLEQQTAAGKAVAEGWDKIVGANIQKK